MPSFPITLRALTPLWTGNATGAMDRIQETGIIGSLRWWYEAIVRGLGHYACDATSDNACMLDANKGSKAVEGICRVCQVFGCTGYARLFRLRVDSQAPVGAFQTVKLRYPGNDRQHRGWRIPSGPVGELTLSLGPTRPETGIGKSFAFTCATVRQTLQFIGCYGALGAKGSQGQGVIVVDPSEGNMEVSTSEWIQQQRANPAKDGPNPLPAASLADLVGVTISARPDERRGSPWWKQIPLTGMQPIGPSTAPTCIPAAPAVRAQLRAWLRDSQNVPGFSGSRTDDRHRLMGVVQPGADPKGSDVYVTHLYRQVDGWKMRVFAFIPQDGNTANRALRALLGDSARLTGEVSQALGGVPVGVTQYPADVLALLNGSAA